MHGISPDIARSLSPFDPRYRNWVMERDARTNLVVELHESIEAKLLELEVDAVVVPSTQSDIIIARIISVNGTINATYTVESIRPPIITLTDVTPINRFFALDSSGNTQVDFLAAPESTDNDDGQGMAKIIKYSGTATGTIASGDGACSFGGDCAITDPALCASLGGVFVEGLQCPGLVVEITENVKISVCPAPVPALRPPPPIVSQIAGVLK